MIDSDRGVAAPPRVDRDLSWIDFNGRVLDEAADPAVPLLERLQFLSIFSSNLDEFFRVRVAGLRSLLRLGRKKKKKLPMDPGELLAEIHRKVLAQQERYGRLIREDVLPALAREGVELVALDDLDDDERAELGAYFEEIRPHLVILSLDEGDADTPPIELEDHRIYLAVGPIRQEGTTFAPTPGDWRLIALPSPPLERFVCVHRDGRRTRSLFLDDVVRAHLDQLFPGSGVSASDAWAVKLSRDADLGLHEEFEGDLAAAVRKSLKKRAEGVPSRFLYDLTIPAGLLDLLRRRLRLEPEDLVEGGRYHNLDDLRSLPTPERDDLLFPPWPAAPHPELVSYRPVLDVVAERDQLVHVPYQSYDAILRFFREAADDPDVEEILLTVYRVAHDSAILEALESAARRGVTVRVFFEVKARFDEASNLAWAERIEAAGGDVLFGTPELKVHAKIALARRRESGTLRNYALLGTGNFNERTARFYTDFALLTADPRIADEVLDVFRVLRGVNPIGPFEHLLVAPDHLRRSLENAVDTEIEAARSGEPAGIRLKLNSLEDSTMIERLYAASRAGVPVQAIVRGICCLAPGIVEWSDSIEVRSIVGRYLEHARIYRFEHGGTPSVYLASADWMTRNLDRRVEVAFPILDPRLRSEIEKVLEIQWASRPKVRRVDSAGGSHYAFPDASALDPQEAQWRYVQELTASAGERA